MATTKVLLKSFPCHHAKKSLAGLIGFDRTFQSIVLAERLSGRINSRTGHPGILGSDGARQS